jgi:hypothetical protein
MTGRVGTLGPRGSLGLEVIRAADAADRAGGMWPTRPLSWSEIDYYGGPQKWLSQTVNAWRKSNRRNLYRGVGRLMLARRLGIPHFYGRLYLTKITPDGLAVPYGLASHRLVTTAGVRFICDDFNAGTTDVTNMKYHGLGTGGTAEAVGDTALVTEITTQYSTDNTRPTGTQASATVSTNATYTTVGTITVDATVAATEHGVLSQAATGGGTLLDRTLFSVINLASADSLQATYVLTINSGG